jgi:hypothetical protein
MRIAADRQNDERAQNHPPVHGSIIAAWRVELNLPYSRRVSFDWLNPIVRRSGARDLAAREVMIRAELAQRAGLFYRLGFTKARAVARLVGNVSWDYEVSGDGRPSWLDDGAISTIVEQTYARRPDR